jgi:hypothetical protein
LTRTIGHRGKEHKLPKAKAGVLQRSIERKKRILERRASIATKIQRERTMRPRRLKSGDLPGLSSLRLSLMKRNKLRRLLDSFSLR